LGSTAPRSRSPLHAGSLSPAARGGFGIALPPPLVAICAVIGLSCTGLAPAQDTAASKPISEQARTIVDKRPRAAGLPVEEVRPEIYLKDKQGNLIAVPGFSFEDFDEFYKLKYKLRRPDQRPQYSLQRLSISGTAGPTYGELTVQFVVVLRESDWVRVPLRLDQALLLEPAQYKGPGQHFLHFEPGGEGYVVWLRSPAEQQHELSLKVLVPLTQLGEETRLRLCAARATASELRLKVPVPGAVAKVSEGANLLPSPAASKGPQELTVVGLSGDFELAWHKPGGRSVEAPTVLESSAVVLTRIDSRSVGAEATLSVHSYGAPFDRFRVRLPPGCELTPGAPSGYTVAPVDKADPAAPDQRVVEVQLAKKTSGPVEVRLLTQRLRDVTRQSEWLDLAGFEVVGAARQWGQLGVAVAGDWQVLWGPARAVRQVDQVPEALRQSEVVAAFEYFAQPFSLSARLVPRRTRIHVEPEYLMLVDANQVKLEARLKYTVRGARVFALDVGLSDWLLDEVGPETLVAADGVAISEANLLSIPLMQPATGQLELRIRAHRPIPSEAKSLTVPLMEPRANSAGPALVAVMPDDNVELAPDVQAMVGLMRQQTGPPLDLAGRQQSPLFYRSEVAKSVFAAGFSVRPQRIGVDVNSQLTFDDTGGRMEQKLSYTIAYEPADFLRVLVPGTLAESRKWQWQHDGKPIPAESIVHDQEESPAQQPARLRIVLPRPSIGPGQLTVSYPVALGKIMTDRPTVLTVPLVMPCDGELTGNRLSVATTPRVKVQPQPGPWTAIDSSPGRAGRRRGLQLVAAQPCCQAEILLQAEAEPAQAAAVVERAWVQTWLTDEVRQETALMTFTTTRRELELIVPEGAAIDQMLILLDGKPATAQPTADDRLMLTLPGEPDPRLHHLEIRYHFPEKRPPRGSMTLELPRLGADAWVLRLYWQLVLPQNEHVVMLPPHFTSEFTWGWQGMFWGRRPLLEQSQLETWVLEPWQSESPAGRPRTQRSPLPEGTNRYLFSNLGTVPRAELRTAGRKWIVLVASGAALVAGLLLIYVRWARHPATLLVAAVLLLAMGMIDPEPMLLAAQAASLGLALALLAGLLERGLARQRRTAVFEELTSSLIEVGSSRGRTKGPLAGEPTTTQALPPGPHTPAESHAHP